MFLTETWLKSHSDPLISDFHAAVNGYAVHQQPRLQRRGGGVAILSRCHLKADNRKTHSFKSFECLEVSFRSQSVLLRTIVVYRPPESYKNKATKNDFLADFSSLLEIVLPLPGFLLIGGDFNLHFGHHESPMSRKFQDLLESRGLSQHVADPTHVKGQTLDLLITRASDQLIDDVLARSWSLIIISFISVLIYLVHRMLSQHVLMGISVSLTVRISGHGLNPRFLIFQWTPAQMTYAT
ncbi:hypothetical protein HOLleu_03133 [Holothuria leucospilota]|uniref:Endonuclease/exonuclease/phosphatase domain-containing protein n=1 Tax=Holothuria leucospilota TaxID=206669 RepID=A0A9Q1CS63_HOLLE|nr:hypothetical protein HOLleu_03133 [Holothuria leucospilota]